MKTDTDGWISIDFEPTQRELGPLDCYVYARDFLEAHKIYEPVRLKQFFSPASCFLICRSLELALKSFLLYKGLTKREIKHPKNLGHDLKKILRKTHELGIQSIYRVSDKEKVEILKANVWYASKGFEYFELRDTRTLPDLEVLQSLSENLLRAIAPLIDETLDGTS